MRLLPSPRFILGANLPWVGYGTEHWCQRLVSGWRTELTARVARAARRYLRDARLRRDNAHRAVRRSRGAALQSHTRVQRAATDERLTY
jgi:hypothetical protein